MRNQIVGAVAATSEATANMAIPPRNARRWPMRSPSFPPTRRSAANVMLYDVNTHASSESGSSNDSRMPGRATLTMVTSIATSSIDTDVMIRICHARVPTSTSWSVMAAIPTERPPGSGVKEPHRSPVGGFVGDRAASRASASRATTLARVRRVTSLELFFDLVFVLAVTQCTAAIAHDPSWPGVVEALAILALLWWAWGGYAWLTSLIDPEEGPVRVLMFGAMAAAVVASLCVPQAFGDLGLEFALAYGVLRVAHLGLYAVGARGEPQLRRSIAGLAVSTAIGLSLLIGASFADGWLQGSLWGLALLLDIGGPFVAGSAGWTLLPEHFAERFGLFVLIALGESVVAIGAGAGGDVTIGVVVAAVGGVAVAAALWWTYFDVVAIVATERLAATPPGREQNDLARDAWAYLHFPMVAGIVLVAFGLKTTLAHVTDPLGAIPAAALLGGVALYLLAHVAFRWRVMHTLNRQRLVVAAVLLALLPVGSRVPALAALAIVVALTCGLVAYETWRFADLRDRVRHHA